MKPQAFARKQAESSRRAFSARTDPIAFAGTLPSNETGREAFPHMGIHPAFPLQFRR